MKQLKSSLKRKVSWNKYQSKVTDQAQHWYLYFLIDPSFQVVSKIFVWLFEDKKDQESYKLQVFLPTIEFSDQPVTNNTWKIATDEGDDYTTECLLDYSYFKQ